jgi:hypothetical protein
VYLNDEFEGGNTSFWTKYATKESTGHCRFLRESVASDADIRIKPVTGSALISDHMIQHEGETPAKGTKYVLRTDIVHEKPVSASKAEPKFKTKKGNNLTAWIRHHEPSCANYSE